MVMIVLCNGRIYTILPKVLAPPGLDWDKKSALAFFGPGGPPPPPPPLLYIYIYMINVFEQ